MARFILKNISQMDVYVPSPNGAGRRIPPGKCVEGNFFEMLLPSRFFNKVKSMEIKEEDILCKYELITTEILVQEQVPEIDTSPGLSEEEDQKIRKELNKDFPTKKHKELNKFNLTELKEAALEAGIEFEEKITKRQLLNLLVAKQEAKSEPEEKQPKA
jgi:hypothetical protein